MQLDSYEVGYEGEDENILSSNGPTISALAKTLRHDPELLEVEQAFKIELVNRYNNTIFGGFETKDDRISFPKNTSLEEVILEIMFLLFQAQGKSVTNPFGVYIQTYKAMMENEYKDNRDQKEYRTTDVLSHVIHYLKYYHLFSETTINETFKLKRPKVRNLLKKNEQCVYAIMPTIEAYRAFIAKLPSQS